MELTHNDIYIYKHIYIYIYLCAVHCIKRMFNAYSVLYARMFIRIIAIQMQYYIAINKCNYIL